MLNFKRKESEELNARTELQISSKIIINICVVMALPFFYKTGRSKTCRAQKNEKQKTTLSRRDQTLCDYYDYIDFWHNVKRQTL